MGKEADRERNRLNCSPAIATLWQTGEADCPASTGTCRISQNRTKADISGQLSAGPGACVPEMSSKCPRFSAGCHGLVRFCHQWKPGVETLLPGLKNFSCYILMHFDAFLRGTPGRKPSLDSWYRTKYGVGKAQLSVKSPVFQGVKLNGCGDARAGGHPDPRNSIPLQPTRSATLLSPPHPGRPSDPWACTTPEWVVPCAGP